VVDDGSVDSTREIVYSIKNEDPRFHYVSKNHSGLIDTLNYGLSQIQNPFLVRMDADDVMPTNRIGDQIGLLKRLGPGHLATGRIAYFPDGTLSQGYKNYETWLNSMIEPGDFERGLFKECPVAAPSWSAFSQDVKKAGGFSPKIYPDDYHFFLKIMLLHQIQIHSTQTPALLWRHHPARLSLNSKYFSQENFWALKGAFFSDYLKHTNQSGRPCRIAGTGSSAKALFHSLDKTKIDLRGFIGIHPGKINKMWQNLLISDWKSLEVWDDFTLIAIGNHQTQKELSDFMNKREKKEGTDYLFFC
jgi:glycosyltransferase involved in cell wall biosynthesis